MKSSTNNAERGTAAQVTPLTTASRATAGAAALGAVFTLPVAVDAGVVYSGVQNINVNLPASQRNASNSNTGAVANSVGLDLDGNSAPDFQLRIRQSYSFSDSDRVGSARLLGLGANLVLASGFEGGGARNFSASNMVSLGQQQSQSGMSTALLRRVFSSGFNSGAQGNFAPGETGFAGVAFDIDGATHFGWIRLLVEDGDQGYPFSVTAIDWAYENEANTPIHVTGLTEVPEANPGLALLAAGGTGLVAWRLRRRKEAKPAAQV
jgi:hypothetical protein